MENQEIINSLRLTDSDLTTLEKHETNVGAVKQQVEQLIKGTKFIKLNKACKLGDGIVKIDDTQKEELNKLQSEYIKNKSVLKFVPASGAATRMFKRLESFMISNDELSLDSLPKNDDEKYLLRFFNNIQRFAFYDALKKVIEGKGMNIELLLKENKLKLILEYLLTSKGLNYSNLPKALIKFHNYGNENRNALEEQVVESLEYIRNSEKEVNLHFTISPELESDFNSEIKKLKRKYDAKAKLNISFSFQKKSTDTVAVDMKDNLFRDGDALLFRPGGHGALIENLNDLDHDLIYVKNIDNVQQEGNLNITAEYKKLLGGLLIKYQQTIYSYLEKLDADNNHKLLGDITQFITDELQYDLGENYKSLLKEEKRTLIKKFLNRPIRVCGVVVNEGHPGGGPFWVEDDDGKISKQIVEGNQLNKSDDEQKKIFNTSTHFNPVDIVCGIKDYRGNKFNLLDFVDDSAVLVAKKSKDGRELKALELPGLWNGAMANWITVFVEVPKETFTPVKEVNDLLQDYHV